MLEYMTNDAAKRHVKWIEQDDGRAPAFDAGCVLGPELGAEPLSLVRRVVVYVLQAMLGPDARVETASVDAVLGAWVGGTPCGGYVVNIQGDLAVSANKHGVRIEPMAAFRARRKPDRS